MQMQQPSSTSHTTSLADAASFFERMDAKMTEERERMEAKATELREEAKAGRVEMEAKLEAQQAQMAAASRTERQEFEARLEKQMQATLQQQQEVDRTKAQAAAAEAEARLRERQMTDAKIAALQSRFQTLHAAKLLADEELYRLEDLVFDSCEEPQGGSAAAPAGASQVASMIALSERAPANEAFARQLRRKFA